MSKTNHCLVILAVLLPQIQWNTLESNGRQYIDMVHCNGGIISEFGGREIRVAKGDDGDDGDDGEE